MKRGEEKGEMVNETSKKSIFKRRNKKNEAETKHLIIESKELRLSYIWKKGESKRYWKETMKTIKRE